MVVEQPVRAKTLLSERVKRALRDADQLQYAAHDAIEDVASTTEAWSLVVEYLTAEVESLRRRIDHLEAEIPHIEPPIPFGRRAELAEDRREINLR